MSTEQRSREGGAAGSALAVITLMDVVRQVFPNATSHDADYLLWNHTAYPFAGHDTELYRSQLTECKAAWDAGKDVCDTCSNPVERGVWQCEECRAFMASQRDSEDF